MILPYPVCSSSPLQSFGGERSSGSKNKEIPPKPQSRLVRIGSMDRTSMASNMDEVELSRLD